MILIFMTFCTAITSVRTCECGISTKTRILHGKSFEAGTFPWLADVVVNDKLGTTEHCSGTLISPNTVITAAHCLTVGAEIIKPQNIKVILGSNKNSLHRRASTSQEIRVMAIVLPPEYSFRNPYDYDIALLGLGKSATMNEFVSPICVPEYLYDFMEQDQFTVAGWGSDGIKETLSERPKEATVNFIRREKCYEIMKKYYGSSRHVKSINEVLDKKICAVGENYTAESCYGDDGGPLMYKSGGRWFLVGVSTVSYTKCGSPNSVGFYTDAISHRDLISTYDKTVCYKPIIPSS